MMTDEETAWLLSVDNQRKEDCVLTNRTLHPGDVVPCLVHGEHFIREEK